MTLPVSKLHMVQIGRAKLPQLNLQCTINYTPRNALDDVHNGSPRGGQIDYYRRLRSPMNYGRFQVSGEYSACGGQVACEVMRHELEWLQGYKGTWQPMLFYYDKPMMPLPEPVECDCRQQMPCQNCGLWLWGHGKILEIQNPMSVMDYLAPQTAEVSISGQLQVLTPVTYSYWRYGLELTPTPAQSKLLQADLEIAQAEPAEEWFVPCGLPELCAPQRFWPRNLSNGGDGFDPTTWEIPYVTVYNGDTVLWPLTGNIPPRTHVVMRGDSVLTIENSLGSFTYSYGLNPYSTIQLDSWTGYIQERRFDGSLHTVAGAGALPFLDWPENRISVAPGTGSAIVGAQPFWIN